MISKKLGVTVTSVFTFLILVPTVFAFLENNVVVNLFAQLFTNEGVSPWVLKFILFWLIFSIFYAVGSNVKQLRSEGGGKGPVITIAIVVALLASIGIPNDVVGSIYRLYSGIFIIILYLLPFGIVYFMIKKTKDMGFMPRIILAILLMFFGIMLTTGFLQQFLPDIISKILKDPVEIAGLVLIIFAILQVIYAFSSFNKGAGTGNGGGFSSMWNPVKGFGGSDPETRRLRNEEKEAKRVAKENEREEKIKKDLLAAEELERAMKSLDLESKRLFDAIKKGRDILNNLPPERVNEMKSQIVTKVLDPMKNEIGLLIPKIKTKKLETEKQGNILLNLKKNIKAKEKFDEELRSEIGNMLEQTENNMKELRKSCCNNRKAPNGTKYDALYIKEHEKVGNFQADFLTKGKGKGATYPYKVKHNQLLKFMMDLEKNDDYILDSGKINSIKDIKKDANTNAIREYSRLGEFVDYILSLNDFKTEEIKALKFLNNTLTNLMPFFKNLKIAVGDLISKVDTISGLDKKLLDKLEKAIISNLNKLLLIVDDIINTFDFGKVKGTFSRVKRKSKVSYEQNLQKFNEIFIELEKNFNELINMSVVTDKNLTNIKDTLLKLKTDSDKALSNATGGAIKSFDKLNPTLFEKLTPK